MADELDSIYSDTLPDAPAQKNPAAMPDSIYSDPEEFTRIAAAKNNSFGKTPEQAARVLKLEAETGMPGLFIQDNIEEVERTVYDQSFNAEAFRKTNPKFTQWLAANPNHYAFAKEDLSFFGNIEKTAHAVKEGWNKAALQHEVVDYIYADMEDKLTPEQRARYQQITKEQEAEGNSARRDTTMSYLGRQAGYGFSNLPRVLGVAAKGAIKGAPYGAAAGFALGGPPAAVGGFFAGAGAGALAESAAYSYTMESAFSYQELMAEKGMDKETAKTVSKGVGILNAIIETGSDAAMVALSPAGGWAIKNVAKMLPGGLTKQGVNAAVKKALAIPTIRVAMVEAAKKMVQGGTIEAMEEFLQAMVGAAGREAAQGIAATEGQQFEPNSLSEDVASAMSQAKDAFVSTFFTGALTHGGPQLLKGMAEVKQAKQTAQFFEALGAGSESKAFQALPDKGQELVGILTEGTPWKTVFVDAGTWKEYWQSKADPKEVAAEVMGDDGAAYEEALATGQTIAIPTERYARKIAPTEHNKFFSQVLRDDPMHMNAEEAREYFQKKEEERAAQAQEPVAEEQQGPSVKEIEQQVQGELTAAGRGAEAKDMAAFHADRARVRAIRREQGENPVELWKQHNLSLSGPDVQQGGDGKSFNQAGDYPQLPVQFNETEGTYEIKVDGGSFSADVVYDNYDQHLSADGSEKPRTKSLQKLSGKYQNVWRFESLQVDPGKRGTGLAAQILDSAIRKAIESGADAIIGNASPFGNKGLYLDDLLEFYKSRGFKVIDRYENTNATIFLDLKKAPKAFFQSTQSRQPAPAFYSKLQQTVEAKMGNSATVEQVRGLTRDLKPEEIKWSGLDDFLKGKEKVSKQELLDFLRANQLEIKEVVKGEVSKPEQFDKFEVVNSKTHDRAELFDNESDAIEFAKKLEEESGTQHGVYAVPYEMGGETETKFSKYTLPGGENYKELLFTLPPAEPKELPPGYRWNENVLEKSPNLRHQVLDSDGRIAGMGPTQEAALADLHRVQPGMSYRSSHFDEPNILAHARFNERVDADGKRVLHIEEIQSDWHQAGRKQGYKGDQPSTLDEGLKSGAIETKQVTNELTGKEQWAVVTKADGKRIGRTLSDTESEAIERAREAWTGLQVNTKAVPDAPFKKTWHEFVLKRMIRYAAENGFDSITWTTGEQQAERYDLSKSVNKILLTKQNDRAAMSIYAFNKSGGQVLNKDVSSEAELASIIGKEAAEKLVAQEWSDPHANGVAQKKLEGDALKIGGEGMKGFYDKMIPDFLNKFGKKFGAKVGEAKLNTEAAGPDALEIKQNLSNGTWEIVDGTGKVYEDEQGGKYENYDSEQEADEIIGQIEVGSTGTKVHSLPITPALKEAALNEGFSLFQGTDDKRGRIRFGKNATNIQFLAHADTSTFIHENGHLWLEELIEDAFVNPKLAKDLDTILEWMELEVRSKDGIEAVREAVQEKQHEQFAEAVEDYIMEGKAPSEKMKFLFAKLQAWMVMAYKALTRGNVKLTPEVRAVFDRMVATDEEIEKQRARLGSNTIFTNDFKSYGLTPAQTEQFTTAILEAEAAAKAMLFQRAMDSIRREREDWYQSEKEKVKDIVRHEVEAEPVYQALHILQHGTRPDGTPVSEEIKLSGPALKREFKPELIKNLPRPYVYTNDGGMHHDIAAQHLGFRSGAELVTQLAAARPIEEVIEEIAEAKMKEKYPDILEDGSLEKEAVEALHNEKQTKLKRLELEFLAGKQPAILKNIAKSLIRRVPTNRDVKNYARSVIGRQLITGLKPQVYLRAEIKAAKEASAAFGRGEYDVAFEHKRNELINHELYKAAMEAEKFVEKAIDKTKIILRKDEKLAKTRDMDLVNAARAILANIGIGKKGKSAADYLSGMHKYADQDQYQAVMAIVQSADKNVESYQELTYDDLVDVFTTVNALWDLSRQLKTQLVEGKRMDRDEIKGELISHMTEKLGPTPSVQYKRAITKWDRTKRGTLWGKAMLRRVESWVDAMDEGNPNGPFRKYIWTPISAAADAYRIAKRDTLNKFLDIVSPIKKELVKKPILAPELGGYEFSGKAHLLGAVLHSGNKSNLSKLLRGRGWGEFDENGVLDTRQWDAFIKRMWDEGVLTKQDYDTVQGIWNLLEELKPLAQRAHKEMYGYYFNEVTADEFETPFGKYKGGYVPAMVDRFESKDIEAKLEREELEKNDNSYMFPTTGRGFTKSRVDEYAQPLVMDLMLIPSHIDKLLRFVHIEPRVKEVGRLVTDKEFRKVLDAYDSEVASTMLIPWLQRAAQQMVQTPNKGWQGLPVWTWLRTNTGLNVMAGNVTNTIQQFTGLSIAAVKVKPKYLRNGLWRYMTDRTLVDTISEKSQFMATRTSSQVIEIMKNIETILLNPTKTEKAIDYAREHAYFLQAGTQNVVDVAVWSGAYEQAVEGGATELEAVRQADSAVRETQGSFSAEDVSRFEADTPFARLFTMFYSYFNMQANLLGTEFSNAIRQGGLKKSAGRLLYVYTLGFMVPAVLSELIVRSMDGNDWDDDDDGYLDEVMSIFFGSQLRTATAMFPFVGPTIQASFNAVNDKWYDDRISTSPAISMLESAFVGNPANLWKVLNGGEVRDKKAIRDLLSLIGLLSGVPVAPLAKPLGYIADVNEKKVKYKGPLDYGRGLITGKGEKRK